MKAKPDNNLSNRDDNSWHYTEEQYNETINPLKLQQLECKLS